MANVDPRVNRNPVNLHSWVSYMNQHTPGRAVMLDDPDKDLEVKKLCILHGNRKITFDEWMYMLNNMDLFDLAVCGPRLAVYKYVRPLPARLMKITTMVSMVDLIACEEISK